MNEYQSISDNTPVNIGRFMGQQSSRSAASELLAEAEKERISEAELAQANSENKSGLGSQDILNALGTHDLLSSYLSKEEVKVEPVAVSDAVDYEIDLSDTGIGEDYFQKTGMTESSNNYNAYNKSGATGKYQFFESTAAPYLKKYNASWDIFKQSPKLQEAVMRDWTRDNINGLKKAGIPINNFTVYTAHQQGLGGAKSIFTGGKLNTKNLASNLPKGMKPTRANYINHWGAKFGARKFVPKAAPVTTAGLSQSEMEELDALLGSNAYTGT